MNSRDILEQAADVFGDRGEQYGDPVEMFDSISFVSSTVLNKNITAYDVAMIFHCAKLCRTKTSRLDMDHYIDGINYLAFAGQFADQE